MTMNDLKEIARERGIKVGKVTKAELIRTLQRAEGNRDCFGEEARLACGENGCLWHADCQPR
jgi:hypothetical protein